MADAFIDMTSTLGPVVETSDSNGLTLGIDIDALIARRDEYVRHLNDAAAALRAAAQYGDATLEIRGCGRYDAKYFPNEAAVQELVRRCEAIAWRTLLVESGMQTFMDHDARQRWSATLDAGTAPALTRENVDATFALLASQRQDMFDRGLISMFKSLSYDYKTNNVFRFGKRIVVKYAISHGTANMPFCDRIDDLLRIMSALDGKPQREMRHCVHALYGARWPNAENDVVIDDYLSLRGFKNGNCHVTFLRPDLVDKMNLLISRHFPNALPAAH